MSNTFTPLEVIIGDTSLPLYILPDLLQIIRCQDVFDLSIKICPIYPESSCKESVLPLGAALRTQVDHSIHVSIMLDVLDIDILILNCSYLGLDHCMIRDVELYVLSLLQSVAEIVKGFSIICNKCLNSLTLVSCITFRVNNIHLGFGFGGKGVLKTCQGSGKKSRQKIFLNLKNSFEV